MSLGVRADDDDDDVEHVRAAGGWVVGRTLAGVWPIRLVCVACRVRNNVLGTRVPVCRAFLLQFLGPFKRGRAARRASFIIIQATTRRNGNKALALDAHTAHTHNIHDVVYAIMMCLKSEFFRNENVCTRVFF